LPDPSTFLKQVVKTWTKHDLRPKFHISDQHPEKRIGSHADFVQAIPDCIFDIASDVKNGIDLMVEAKKKELAVQKLFKTYVEP
jgi:UV DNA damage repair endonuclease